jgi:Tfp pilus assembly protein PilN
MALAAVPFILPLLATALLAGQWLNNSVLLKTELAVHRQNLQHIAEHAEDLHRYETAQQNILAARHRIKNVQDALRFELPLSPVLAELAQTLPPEVYFTELDIDYQPVRRKQVDPKNNQVTYIQVIQRTLRLTLAAPNRPESDQAVKDYIQTLRSAPCLSGIAQEIQIQSRQEASDSQNLILYEIRCPLIEQK